MMPYTQHPVFTPPDDPNATIWRYMDFTKLVSLLDSSALYFARADTFPDAFEGSLPAQNVEQRKEWFPTLEVDDLTVEEFATYQKRVRLQTFINCWNLSSYESAALWGLYVSQTGGVAVRSSFKRLTESFAPSSDQDPMHAPADTPIYVGKVSYVDYAHDVIPEGNAMLPFVHKRRSFEFEHELRAVIRIFPATQMEMIEEALQVRPMGHRVKVDLSVLVDEIRISPAAPHWFAELVENVCDRYSLNKSVKQSELAGDPVY